MFVFVSFIHVNTIHIVETHRKESEVSDQIGKIEPRGLCDDGFHQ